VENHPPTIAEGISGLLKMAGTVLIALAIPLGVGVAVLGFKRHGGIESFVLCFSVMLAMSVLGFVLILASGRIVKSS